MAEAIRDTIGCDLGDKFSEMFIVKANGTTETPERVKTTQAGMKVFFTRTPAHVVVENGTHSRWVSAMLKELGHDVTVANARRVQLISQSKSKNDKKDAQLLARLGRADIELLSPIKHRADGAQADLAVPKVRDALVGCRTKLVNQARGLVKSFGLRLPGCEAEAFHRRMVGELPESLKPALEPLLKALEMISEQIKQLEKKVNEVAKRYPDVEVISRVDGVGVLTALVFCEPNGRRLPWATAATRSVGGHEQATPHHEGRGPVPSPTLGEWCELHLGALRQGLRAQTLGAQALRARRKECATEGEGRCREKAGSADAPPLGNGRGLPAAGLRSESRGVDDDCRRAEIAQDIESQSRTNEPPRPSDCDCRLEPRSSIARWQHSDGSDPNVHRCAIAQHPECGWKCGGAVSRAGSEGRAARRSGGTTGPVRIENVVPGANAEVEHELRDAKSRRRAVEANMNGSGQRAISLLLLALLPAPLDTGRSPHGRPTGCRPQLWWHSSVDTPVRSREPATPNRARAALHTRQVCCHRRCS